MLSFCTLAAFLLLLGLLLILGITSGGDPGGMGAIGFMVPVLAILLIVLVVTVSPFLLIGALFIKNRLFFLPRLRLVLNLAGILCVLLLITGTPFILGAFSFVYDDVTGARFKEVEGQGSAARPLIDSD